jgi:hypothetical protein
LIVTTKKKKKRKCPSWANAAWQNSQSEPKKKKKKERERIAEDSLDENGIINAPATLFALPSLYPSNTVL